MKFPEDLLSLKDLWSLPSRERGLKLSFSLAFWPRSLVAPLAGAWIEISCSQALYSCRPVAPLAGAWIEMKHVYPPSYKEIVAPLAGAWIEILNP